jgi:hypothetical protein
MTSETGDIRPGVAVTDLVAAGRHKGALARLDQQIVETVLRTSELASCSPGMMLPTDPAFAGHVAAVRQAAKSDMSGADQTAIREFVLLFAQRRNLPAPSSLGLDLDAAVMSAWPADLFCQGRPPGMGAVCRNAGAESAGLPRLYRRRPRGTRTAPRRAPYLGKTLGDNRPQWRAANPRRYLRRRVNRP